MAIQAILSILLAHLPTLALITTIAYLAKNYFNNGLNKYPGPLLAQFTDWWRFWDVYKRSPEETHIALHKKHGDVVRLGPNYLSFSDPAATKAIYGLNKGYVKVCVES